MLPKCTPRCCTQGLVTKSRADLNIVMKEFARESAESQMEGGLQDGAGLLEVVGLPSYLLFSTS